MRLFRFRKPFSSPPGSPVSHPANVTPQQEPNLTFSELFTDTTFPRLLLQYRADPNAVDVNNDTPLSWAAMKGNFDCVKVLLEYNALPDIVSYGSMLPITRVAILLAAGLNTPEDETCFEYLMRAMGGYLCWMFSLHTTLLPEKVSIYL